MKQQRLESTYFMKVIFNRESLVSTAARMSAWRANEWFLLSDSRLEDRPLSDTDLTMSQQNETIKSLKLTSPVKPSEVWKP